MRRFVVVEGLIGVGKTSLCRLLERHWGARVVLEPSETNPFLEPFYTDPATFALPVQLFYLMNRWRQQAMIRQEDLFAEVVVADYLWEKDHLFAEKTLSDDEMEIYERFTRVLGEQAPAPDLVVFLDAPTSVLMQRIARRQAPGEQAIEPAYLDDLRERYRKLLGGWMKCPVLELDNQDMNYVDDPEGQAQVIAVIEAALEARRPLPADTQLDSKTPGSASDREAQPSLFGTESP